MHIPSSMLGGKICPVTAVVSVIGVVAAVFCAYRSKNKPSAGRFGAITALIFAGQMINFPIQNGTSGHLIGGVLAAVLLGPSFGVLAIALVVTIQCIVFSDGGFTVLGANVFNMAIIGAGLWGGLNALFSKNAGSRSSAHIAGLGIIAWFSVITAAFVCSVELAASGTIEFSKVIPAILVLLFSANFFAASIVFAFELHKVLIEESKNFS